MFYALAGASHTATEKEAYTFASNLPKRPEPKLSVDGVPQANLNRNSMAPFGHLDGHINRKSYTPAALAALAAQAPQLKWLFRV